MANPHPTYKIQSREEAQRLGRLGGIASGETRRTNRELRNCIKGGLHIPSKEVFIKSSPMEKLVTFIMLTDFIAKQSKKYKREQRRKILSKGWGNLGFKKIKWL